MLVSSRLQESGSSPVTAVTVTPSSEFPWELSSVSYGYIGAWCCSTFKVRRSLRQIYIYCAIRARGKNCERIQGNILNFCMNLLFFCWVIGRNLCRIWCWCWIWSVSGSISEMLSTFRWLALRELFGYLTGSKLAFKMNVYPYTGTDAILIILFCSSDWIGGCFAFFIFYGNGIWSQTLYFPIGLSYFQLILASKSSTTFNAFGAGIFN